MAVAVASDVGRAAEAVDATETVGVARGGGSEYSSRELFSLAESVVSVLQRERMRTGVVTPSRSSALTLPSSSRYEYEPVLRSDA